MDQTIDMSDISQNSHLCLFSLLQQQQIIQKLSSPKIEARSACDMVAFENVIEKVRTKFNLYPELFDWSFYYTKFRGIQDIKKILCKTIKEIYDIKTDDKRTRKIYLQMYV